MTKKSVGAALLLSLLASTSSWAAATPEEAARLTAVFQSYLGTAPGVVSVTPDGDGYAIVLDASPYLAKIPDTTVKIAIDPLRFSAVPTGDGLWAVKAAGPYKASMNGGPDTNITLDVKNYSWSGTYSEKLYSMTESTYAVDGLNMVQHTMDPSTKMVTDQTTVIESFNGKGTATGSSGDAVDSESQSTITNLSGATKITLPPEMAGSGMPDLSYNLKVGSIAYGSSIKAFAARPLLDLAAFFVAHPSKELIIQDQAVLKEKLLAALPLFASLTTSATYGSSTIETSFGNFTVGEGKADVALNGAVKDGKFAEAIAVKDFVLPASLPLPPWSKGLVPKDIAIGFEVNGFDLDTTARKFITEMDVSKETPVPPGSETAYLQALLPTQTVNITIPPGSLVADLYQISFEGTTSVNVATPIPVVAMKVRMTGMDKVTAQLTQAAADPMAQQALAGLFAAKGMAKADGDALLWEISMGPEGKLLVNGQDISGMVGGPPPQQ